jgi:transcriptional regulator with XRE-family HTH domain
MSDLARQLGKRIYLFRKENGLTQAALAEKAKISNEFMSGIERGAKLPSLATLEKLAVVLRVNIKDFFNFDPIGYRRIHSLSRESADIALLLDTISPQKRRRILKVAKMLNDTIEP